jgi:tRNA (mo5U34)-methyltransferase
VLDAGCGNGYYAWRMRGAGARAVVGVDPTLLYVAQFQAIRHWCRGEPVWVLPLRLAELPREGVFDTTFSMGVLSHQRTPLEHLGELRQTLKQGGELVLETLILPGDRAEALAPRGRYARMRNVWLLPTLPELAGWLRRAGFSGLRTVDVSVTSPREQRATEWMPFQSLIDALDPADPDRTVEGWPAPRRAVVLCRRDA